MRALMLLAALLLLAGPAFTVSAHADGIERPRPRVTRRAPPPRPAPPPVVEREAVQETPSNVVTLPESFFAGAGGVGADIATGAHYYHGGATVIVRGGGSSAFAFASARASARSGFSGGFRGGHGCACR